MRRSLAFPLLYQEEEACVEIGKGPLRPDYCTKVGPCPHTSHPTPSQRLPVHPINRMFKGIHCSVNNSGYLGSGAAMHFAVAFMYVCTYVLCMYICIYVCIYVCMYVAPGLSCGMQDL